VEHYHSQQQAVVEVALVVLEVNQVVQVQVHLDRTVAVLLVQVLDIPVQQDPGNRDIQVVLGSGQALVDQQAVAVVHPKQV